MQYEFNFFGVPINRFLIMDLCPPVIPESNESLLFCHFEGIVPIMKISPDTDTDADDGMFLSEESTEITRSIFDHIPPCFATEKPLCDWWEVEHGRLAA